MTHQCSTGDLGEFTGIEGQSGKNMCQGGKPDTGKFHSSNIVCGCAYENGCVVDGTCATVLFIYDKTISVKTMGCRLCQNSLFSIPLKIDPSLEIDRCLAQESQKSIE